MKTQKTKHGLNFDKKAIVELNDKQMLEIGGDGSISFSIEVNKETVEVWWITINY